MLSNDLYAVFLKIAFLCSQNDRMLTKDAIVRAMFAVAIQQRAVPIQLHMNFVFKSLLMRSTGTMVPLLLTQMRKDLSQINEANMALL